MSAEWLEFKVENIDGGSALQQLNFQLQRAIENVLDVNTDPKASRKVTLKITMKPNGDRTEVGIEYQADSKLPPDESGSDRVHIGKGQGFLRATEQLVLDGFNPVTGEELPPAITTAANDGQNGDSQ